MLGIFQSMAGRIRAMFVTHVALDLEAELVAQNAVRKAGLLRQADQYAAEGMEGVAEELREQAGRLSLDRPLAGVLPAVEELRRPLDDATLVALPTATPATSALATVPPKRRKPR